VNAETDECARLTEIEPTEILVVPQDGFTAEQLYRIGLEIIRATREDKNVKTATDPPTA